MEDINKIIKGWERCKECKMHPVGMSQAYLDCEYTIGLYCGQDKLEWHTLELLKGLPKWIPVSERKPRSIANKVIVYLQHEDLVPQIGYGHYEKYQGEELWYDLETGKRFDNRGYCVTHWMPMPKSPEGEELILY